MEDQAEHSVKKAPIVWIWACLIVGWIFFLLPIPGVSLVLGGLLTITSLILAIITINNGHKKRGMIPLISNVVGSPVIYIIGFIIFGVIISSNQKLPDVEVPEKRVTETETKPTPEFIHLLDGEIPSSIQEMMDGYKALLTLKRGVLTVKFDSPDAITETVYRAVISSLVMSRWLPEVDSSDAPEKPVWSGITEVRVLNNSGSQGLVFKAGDSGFDDIEKLKDDEEYKYLQAHTESFGELSQSDKDSICRQNLECWAEKHLFDATIRCQPAVEKLGQYTSKWVDKLLEPKFSNYRWANKEEGTVIYIGDRIEFQNGYGAFQPHTYFCTFNPVSNKVVSVDARPGRL